MDQFWKWLAGLGDEATDEKFELEFLSLPTGGVGLALLLGFLAVAAGIYFIYRRDAGRLSPGKRLTLATLRIAAVASVALILLEPSYTKVRKVTRPGEVILLIDSSQSMGHKDSYSRRPELAMQWKKIGIVDPSQFTRIELAKKVLSPEVIKTLAAKNVLTGYQFGPGIRRLAVKTKDRQIPKKEEQARSPALLPEPPDFEFEKLLASDGSTNIAASLRQAMEKSRDSRIAGVVLITDGRRNVGGSIEELAGLMRRRKVGKLLVLPVGDPSETWFVEVKEIQAAEKVFKGDPLKVSALVSSQGYGSQSLSVKLSVVADDGKTSKEVSRIMVNAGGENLQALAEFPPVMLEKEGDYLLVAEIEPPLGEDFDEARHRRQQKVTVLSERMKVLLISGGPSHEYRILRNQLIRDKTIDISCWLLSADKDFPQDGNIVLKELPQTPKELDKYAVVILMSPDVASPLMTLKFSEDLAKAVRERGTGLWWSMGEKFARIALQPGSPLKPLLDLLPVEADIAVCDKMLEMGLFWKPKWEWKLTPEGKEHRISRLHPDKLVNETYWSKLPGFHFAIPLLRAKPAAQVLIRHASTLPEHRSYGGPWPIVATHFVGSGRVLYCGTDETYRWRSVAEEAYNSFWVKGLRYLYEGKLAGGSSRFRLGVSVDKVTLGQEVEIYCRVLNERFEPATDATLAVQLKGPGGLVAQAKPLKLSSKVKGRYVGSFRPSMLGSWSVSVSNQVDPNNPPAPVFFEVIRSELESQGPMNLAALTGLAEGSGFEVLSPDGMLEAAKGIASMSRTETFRQHHPLWDKWFTMALLLFFLTLEWILRKLFDLI